MVPFGTGMPIRPNQSGDRSLLGKLPYELAENLCSANPWWDERAAPRIPEYRRAVFPRLSELLTQGPAPAVVLRGPRQVGKTVLLRQLIEQLLERGVEPRRILFVSFDELPTLEMLREPVLQIARWFEAEKLCRTFNEMDRSGRPAYVLLDEVQNVNAWAEQLKNLVDSHRVRVFLTGSSSLRIEAGRDSLAGRVTYVDLGPLLLREIAGIRFKETIPAHWSDEGAVLGEAGFWRDGLSRAAQDVELRARAFELFSERGAYPFAHERHDLSVGAVAGHLNETVIKRAIQHDLRMGERGRKRDERLLEEVFRLCCRYAGQTPGQAVFLPEINQALGGHIAWQRVLSYLRFLDGTLLIRLVPPLELRLKKKRAATDRVCLCDHALRASWLQESIPLDAEGLQQHPHLHDLAGHLAESVLGYYLASIPNVGVAHVPLRGAEPEVDFVITVGARRIPIEVKYRRRIDPYEDTRGLRAFLEKTVYNAPFGLLVTLDDDVSILDPRIIPISLSSFLWLR